MKFITLYISYFIKISILEGCSTNISCINVDPLYPRIATPWSGELIFALFLCQMVALRGLLSNCSFLTIKNFEQNTVLSHMNSKVITKFVYKQAQMFWICYKKLSKYLYSSFLIFCFVLATSPFGEGLDLLFEQT